MSTLRTTMPIENWDENHAEELDGGGTVKRADVTLGAGPDGLGPGTARSLLHYTADGTSTYVSVMSLRATVEGRSGTLVLVGEGTHDGTTASSRERVVEATGELAGLTGTATSSSTAEDYPNMPLTLEYELT